MNQETKNKAIERFEDAVEAATRKAGWVPQVQAAAEWGQILAGIAACEALELSQRAANVIGPRPYCAGCGGTGQGSCGEPCRYCYGTGLVP